LGLVRRGRVVTMSYIFISPDFIALFPPAHETLTLFLSGRSQRIFSEPTKDKKTEMEQAGRPYRKFTSEKQKYFPRPGIWCAACKLRYVQTISPFSSFYSDLPCARSQHKKFLAKNKEREADGIPKLKTAHAKAQRTTDAAGGEDKARRAREKQEKQARIARTGDAADELVKDSRTSEDREVRKKRQRLD
jgi:hypothetical protein